MEQFLQQLNQGTYAEVRIQSPSTHGQEEPVAPPDFVPLDREARTHVSTAVLCQHLGRKPQTARGWACHETYPEGLKPVRVMGRLAWPVAGIRTLLGLPAATVQAESKGRAV